MKCSVRIFLLSTIHFSIFVNMRLLTSKIAMIALLTCLDVFCLLSLMSFAEKFFLVLFFC